jgi:hypothetical protein
LLLRVDLKRNAFRSARQSALAVSHEKETQQIALSITLTKKPTNELVVSMLKVNEQNKTPFLPHVFRPNPFFTDFPPKAIS